ncbi:hypothetical protein ACS3SW_16460 [Roseobacteraceae bacterium S113]
MQVILHAGAHRTDDDKLLRTLFKNQEDVRPQGVAMPKPSSYRKLLSATMNALTNSAPSEDARDIFMEAIMGADRAPVERLILSSESFFTVPKMALGGGRIYPRAGERMRNVQKLFRGDEIELFIGLRNPATWLPAVYAATPHEDFLSFLNGCEVPYLRWYELIYRIREEAPSIPVTVWCNEDTPLVWGELVRETLGLNPGVKIKGAFDLLSEIMSSEGMQRFRAYLDTHASMTEVQKRRVMVAFLDKFALEDEVEEELDLPGWTEDFVDQLSDIYDEDVYAISRLPGVTVVQP